MNGIRIAASRTVSAVVWGLLAYGLFAAYSVQAQEAQYVRVSSVNSGPYVCTVDGVVQPGTHTATHTASTRVLNLKMANPDADVQCARQEVLRGEVSSELRDLIAGNAPPPPDPDSEPDPPGAEPGDPPRIIVIAPTRNTDGSPLTDLESIRIAYSASASGPFETIADIPAPLTGPTTIDGLPSGVSYFVAFAVTSRGAVSEQSNVVSRVLQ